MEKVASTASSSSNFAHLQPARVQLLERPRRARMPRIADRRIGKLLAGQARAGCSRGGRRPEQDARQNAERRWQQTRQRPHVFLLLRSSPRRCAPSRGCYAHGFSPGKESRVTRDRRARNSRQVSRRWGHVFLFVRESAVRPAPDCGMVRGASDHPERGKTEGCST